MPYPQPTAEQAARGQLLSGQPYDPLGALTRGFGFLTIAQNASGRYYDPTGYQEQRAARRAALPTMQATYPPLTGQPQTPQSLNVTLPGGQTQSGSSLIDQINAALSALNQGQEQQQALMFPSVYNTDF